MNRDALQSVEMMTIETMPGMARLFPVMAWATLVSALMAVVMGGVVRVTGSGLGCPDWPLCHGQIIPPWELESWLEYLHRLSAAVAGVFTFLMVVTGFKRYGLRDRSMYLVLLAAGLLVTQATLGAYTVLSELSPGVALVHTATATGLVGLLAVIVAGVVRPLVPVGDIQRGQQLDRFRWLMVSLGLVAFLVILSGAYVTRTGASSVCTEIPLCGALVEDMVDLHWIHMAHRGMVVVVGFLMMTVLGQALAMWRKPILVVTGLMGVLLATQIGLGMGVVLLRLPQELRALHLAVAVLLFAVIMFLVGSLWSGALVGQRRNTSPDTGSMAPTRALQ
jgi:heme A synthase